MAKRQRRKSQQPELVRHDGDLCAYFVNTANAKRRSISSYADLLAWGLRAEALSAADAQRLERMAGERTADAEAVFVRARDLRERLERILLALTRHRAPAAADLDALSADLAVALAPRRLVPAPEGGWRLAWGDRGGDDLDHMLWPVVTSAVNVLTTRYHRKVRQCEGKDCRLLLVDRSPGSPRKWCSACGGRSRALKHYHAKVKPERESWKRLSVEERAERYRRNADFLEQALQRKT